MSNISAAIRLMRAGWIMAREGVLSSLPVDDAAGLPALGHKFAKVLARKRAKDAPRSERISRAMNKLGPSYVKLGQFLATRPDIVGKDVAADLELLQDRLDFFPQAEAVSAVENSLGRKIDDLYVSFDAPIAAASMAQVHPAYVMKDGAPHKVAVKVIRPGVRQRFARDLESFSWLPVCRSGMCLSRAACGLLRWLKRFSRQRASKWICGEAAALSEIAENIKDDEGFRVPDVDWERTGRDVLTLEWIDGIKMSDIGALNAAGFDLKKLAETLIQSFLRHTLRDGFSMPTCIRVISSSIPKALLSPLISALPDGSTRISGAFSQKFFMASSHAIICALRKCILKPVMFRTSTMWRVLRRQSARLVSLSMDSQPKPFPWQSCSRFCLK
ncbi:hypothetical protein HGG75_05255 [Ochrobactrum pseudogrignonense]|nr:hypothetical protein [Brucella pseudogrignonensis]